MSKRSHRTAVAKAKRAFAPTLVEPAKSVARSDDAAPAATVRKALDATALTSRASVALDTIRSHPIASAAFFASMVLSSKGVTRALVVGLGLTAFALSRLDPLQAS